MATPTAIKKARERYSGILATFFANIDRHQGDAAPTGAVILTRLRQRSRSMAQFRPLHDRILVKRIEVEEKTPGGIIIPDTAKEKPIEGEVLAVGPGARDETGTVQPLDVRVGDRVLFGKWSGTEVIIEGEDRLIMKESDVFGVIEGGAHSSARAA
jgi:chaperonin GroES